LQPTGSLSVKRFLFSQRFSGFRVFGAHLVAVLKQCDNRTALLLTWRLLEPRFYPKQGRIREIAVPSILLKRSQEVFLAPLGAGGTLEAVSVQLEKPGKPWMQELVLRDLRSARVLKRIRRWWHAAGRVEAMGTPGTAPDVTGNEPVPFALPGLWIQIEDRRGRILGRLETDGYGFFEYATDPNAAFLSIEGLSGPWITVRTEQGEDLKFHAPLRSGASYLLNSPPKPSLTSQVNAFRHIELARKFVQLYDPGNPVLLKRFLVRVNVPDLPCNGAYGAGVFAFGSSSEICPNPAYSTVIHHEFGHAVLDEVYSGTTGPTTALAEGLADSFTVLLNADPRIARGLRNGEPGRDASKLYRWPEDMTREEHVAGLIVAGAWWDLRERLTAEAGLRGAQEACSLFFAFLKLVPLRIDPGLGRMVLFADDDDADLSNGTPHFAAIREAFGRHGLLPPPWQGVIFKHLVVPDVPLGGAPTVRVLAIGELKGPVWVRYSVNNGREHGFTLSSQPEGYYVGGFPPLSEPGIVSYRIEGTDAAGNKVWAPTGAPSVEAWRFAVGNKELLLEEDFEGEAPGWRSGAWEGINEWQIGEPTGGGLWDPDTPYQGDRIAGIDLGGLGRDGNYRAGAFSFLQSPSVPVPQSVRSARMLLRFARCLSVAPGDEAWVEVNGKKVWSSGGVLLIDDSWKVTAIDITEAVSEAERIQIAFILRAREESPASGGWNLDAVTVEAVTAGPAFIRGDADLSGTLRVNDALRILDAVFQPGRSLSCQDAADVNDDGVVDVSDALRLLAYLFSEGAPPPEPFPSAGGDPSPDGLTCGEPEPLLR